MTPPSTNGPAAPPPRVRFALIDAAALSSEQRRILPPHGDEACWVYAGLDDEQACDMGPVLTPATPAVMDLVEQLWAEPATRWAASIVESGLPWPLVERRLAWMRHVHTADGQRYFFRFADSRCFVAMCQALGPGRRRQLLAGWRSWRIRGRDGEPVEIRGEPQAELPMFRLCLSARELAALLDQSWPDQLLASARECLPATHDPKDEARQYGWMRRLCDLFTAEKIEAYPVQIAAAVQVLEGAGQPLDDAGFGASLRDAQAEHETKGP